MKLLFVIKETLISLARMWSDEARFKLNGLVNYHNYFYWNVENPHVFMKQELEVPRVNVWCGSKKSFVTLFVQWICTDHSYIEKIQDIIPQLLMTTYLTLAVPMFDSKMGYLITKRYEDQ